MADSAETPLPGQGRLVTRYDLLRIMIAQAGVNDALTQVIERLQQGLMVGDADIAKVAHANEQVLSLLDKWLSEDEARRG